MEFSFDDKTVMEIDCEIIAVCDTGDDNCCHNIVVFTDGKKFDINDQRKELFEYVKENGKLVEK